MWISGTGGSQWNVHKMVVNKQLDPENNQLLMDTSLPTPTTARVYVNLPEGIFLGHQEIQDFLLGYEMECMEIRD